MSLWTYSPEDVVVLLGGFHPVEGFIDGTFVTITKDVPPYTSTRSTDGMVARKYVNDQTFTITLNIISMSPTNDVLTKLWLVDESTQMGKFPLLIKDAKGSGVFFSSTTWIEKPSDLSFSSTPEIRTWILRSAQGLLHIGGNDSLDNTTSLILGVAASGLPLVQQTLQDLKGGL